MTDGHPAAVRARIIDDVNELRRRRTPRLARLLVAIGPVAVIAVSLYFFGWPGRRSPAVPATSTRATDTASAPCAPPYRIELRARTAALMSYAVDGQPRQEISLPAMSRRTFEVSHDLDLRVTDAGAIDVLVDGVVRPPMGAAGAAATVHIIDFCAANVSP